MHMRLFLVAAMVLMAFTASATDYFDPTGMQVNQGVITCVNGSGSVSPCSSIEVCSSPTVTPAATPSNPNGVFSLADIQHFPIILGTGTNNGLGGSNWPIHVDYVGLWKFP